MSPKDPQPSDARNGLPIREPATRAHESSTNQNPPVESSDESPVEELFSFAADFASKGGLKKLKSLRQDNERLKQDNINLRATNKENLDAYSESRDLWHAEKREFLSQLDEQKQIHETLCDEQKKNRQLGDQMQALDNSVLQLVQANKAGEARIQQLTTQEVKNKETIDQETNRRTQLQHQLGELDKQLRTRDERLLAAEKNLAVVRAFLVQLVPLEKKQSQLFVEITNLTLFFRPGVLLTSHSQS
jgi:chromosome segregation ATPase